VVIVGVGLALLAAVIHGTWNVLVKSEGDPLSTFRRATLMAGLVASVLLLPEIAVFGRPAVTFAAVGLCVISSVLETVYLVLLSMAYRRGELSAVYPIARGSAPLIAVAVGLVVFRERLSVEQLAGVALLLVGIAAVAFSQAGGRATIPALVTGVAIASYTLVDRLGVRMTAPWFYAWLLFALMAIELPVALALSRRLMGLAPGDVIPTWSRAAVIGGSMWAGYFLVLWALSLAPVAVVAPVRETSIVAIAAWGVWRLRERRAAALKLSGAAVTLAGVALLAV
ncbi:MAG TPA: DMT family transporter, partial [Candidatus Dormibacteraeota bacterium]|nr:DMT family transporter [Candidatus Dormibacteraeota bacterium]